MTPTLAPSGSYLLSQAGSLPGSHWLSLPLSGILWPSLAHYSSEISRKQPLIGSQGPCSALIADATMTHFIPLWSEQALKGWGNIYWRQNENENFSGRIFTFPPQPSAGVSPMGSSPLQRPDTFHNQVRWGLNNLITLHPNEYSLPNGKKVKRSLKRIFSDTRSQSLRFWKTAEADAVVNEACLCLLFLTFDQFSSCHFAHWLLVISSLA